MPRPGVLTRALRSGDRSAVLQFAASGLLATLLIGVVAVGVLRGVGEREAIDDAKRLAVLAGNGIVAPAIDEALMAGDKKAIRRLDRLVKRNILGDGVVRVKVWSGDGRVIYSDEPRLIGDVYPLDEEDVRALGTDGVEADVSDLHGEENRFERRFGDELLEVYMSVKGPRGEPLLF